MRILVSDCFEIAFEFNRKLTSAVKKLPDIFYDRSRKAWTVPLIHEERVKEFAQRFDIPIVKLRKWEKKDIPPMPELEANIPLKLTPYPYQSKGIAYNIKHKRVLIGDKMGLGKTCQAIASVVALNAFPCLVICPASLKINWQREWRMWTDKRVSILNNTNRYSWPQFASGNSPFGVQVKTDVFICNYESLSKFFVDYYNVPRGVKPLLKDIVFNKDIDLFKSVVIDEAHRVKEPSTLQTKLTRGICNNKEVIFAISGTPIVNKAKDLASELAILGRINEFGGYKNFVTNYGFNDHLEELHYKLSTTCFYSRNKKEVLTELPDKIRTVVPCDITTRREYDEALADLSEYLYKYKNATDQEVARAMRGEVMVRIHHLKHISARGKLNDVCDYISDVIEQGEKIILFCHLKEVAGMILQRFPEAVSVLGDDSMAQRQQNIDAFQKDDSVNVIVCSIKAAGVGLTLTASSNVAFIELPWTASDTDQCEDRSHRIGQKDSVNCIYFLGAGTIDEDIYELIKEKRNVSNKATGGKNEAIEEQSTFEDLIRRL